MRMDLTLVAKKACRAMRLHPMPKMVIKKTRRGRAYPQSGYYTIPEWATQRHLAYAIAYIIHELTHFDGQRLRSHGKTFRRIESETAEQFGLRLVYRGNAYLREIRCLNTNRVLCEKYGNPVSEIAQCEHPACLI